MTTEAGEASAIAWTGDRREGRGSVKEKTRRFGVPRSF